jgi:hypothetical protein
MTRARIFQPAKTAMQSGFAKTRYWVLEFEPAEAQRPDPLMGWNGSGDTRNQISLKFPTKEEAIAHAEKMGYEYEVREPKTRRIHPKSYAENFRYDRVR